MKIWEAFDGLDRAYGTYVVTDKEGKKLSGQARTLQAEVTQDIWDLHLSGERSLGIIPIRDDNTVVFAAIDIDTYPLDHAALEEQVRDLGFPLLVVRSKSGGAHLYLFIKPPGAPADIVRQRLAEWAAELGFSGVEIFPKQDELRSKEDVGNWINMPYFGGNDDELRYAIINKEKADLATFCNTASKIAIDASVLKDFQVETEDHELLEGGPPCLQTLLRNGFPTGSRNISLFNLGVLARKKYGDDWQDKIDEMNEEIIEPPLSPGEVAQIKRNLEKKTYFYKCNDSPINSVCQKGICVRRPFGIGGDEAADLEGFKTEGSIRILTEEVYYIVTIRGKRVHLDAQAMCAQHAFRIAVMKQTGFMVPVMKPRVFHQMITDITETAQQVEAPQHSGRKGSLLQEVLQIASAGNTAENWTQCLSGLPYPDGNGGCYLHPHQLVKILKRRLQMRGLQPQELFEALTSEGINIDQRKIGGRVFWQLKDIAVFDDIEEEEEI